MNICNFHPASNTKNEENWNNFYKHKSKMKGNHFFSHSIFLTIEWLLMIQHFIGENNIHTNFHSTFLLFFAMLLHKIYFYDENRRNIIQNHILDAKCEHIETLENVALFPRFSCQCLVVLWLSEYAFALQRKKTLLCTLHIMLLWFFAFSRRNVFVQHFKKVEEKHIVCVYDSCFVIVFNVLMTTYHTHNINIRIYCCCWPLPNAPW